MLAGVEEFIVTTKSDVNAFRPIDVADDKSTSYK